MNLYALSRAAVPSAFIVISLTSTIYIAASTDNYLGFYPGIERITANISTISFIAQTSPNPSGIMAEAFVDNPSGYSGFRASLLLYAYLLPSNMSNSPLFKTRPVTFSSLGWASMAPHSQVGLNITTSLDAEDSASISRYLALNSGNVTVHTTLELYISTFLDSAVGAINANPAGTVKEVPLIVT